MAQRRIAPLLVAGIVVAVAACTSSAHHPSAAPAQPTTSTSATSTTLPPAFASSVATVTAADLSASWRPGCPVPVEQLRAIDARFWGFDGAVHEGRIVVAAVQADNITSVLRDLFAAHYPIHKMEPVDRYGGSDDASVAADNTSAFNCRPVTGSTGWSEHAYGRAVDLNPLENPYVMGSTVLPAQSAALLDRTRTDMGIIHDGDAAVQAFAKVGWSWGGRWTNPTDYQHFSSTGH